MRILVTGGAGYIGSALVQQLSKQKEVEHIVVYDNLSRGDQNFFVFSQLDKKKVSFVEGDLLDSRKLRQSLKGIDVVYHLAANVGSHLDAVDSHVYEQVNHWGTAELVYAIEESQVKKVVYLSSTAVYGGGSQLQDEQAIPNPRTSYGVSKMRGENHVQRLESKIQTVTFRCGNVYGFSPSPSFDGVMNKFLFDANFKGRISINGNGRQSRPFIHMDQVTQVLSEFLFKPQLPSGTYNLVDKNLQILDIVEVLKEIFPELEFIFINQHLDLRDIKVAPSPRLAEFISLPTIDLKEALIAYQHRLAF